MSTSSSSSSSSDPSQSSDSLSSVPSEAEAVESQDVTAENAAAILAADDDIDDPDANETDQPHRGKPSRRTLLTIGGLAATAAVGTGAYLTIRRTNQGVIGAHEALPLVIGGDICAAPLYAAYHRGFFDDAGLKVTLARTAWAPVSTLALQESSSPGWSRSTTASTPGSPQGSTPAACAWWCARTPRIRSWLT